MGQLADDMINGRSCSICGCYFKNPAKPDEIFEHGYPVSCEDCYDPEDDLQLSNYKTF